MNRNNILISVMAVIGVMFVSLLALLTRLPLNKINQITNQNQSPTNQEVPDIVRAELKPDSVGVKKGQTFTLNLSYQNLPANIEASDLIINYDPSLIRFVSVENLNSNYINPRALVEDGRLVLSFVNQTTLLEKLSALTMADLVFETIKPGSIEIEPVINTQANSSTVITQGSSANQLTSGNKVNVLIN